MMDFDTFEYSQAQKSILKYIKTQFKGVRVRPIGEDRLQVTDSKGGKLNLSLNLYGDILDADTKQVIAKSDLPHSMDELKVHEMPKSWDNCPEYFG